MASECWLEIHFVNVGYGDCTIIALFEADKAPGATVSTPKLKESMLIDCGVNSSHVPSYARAFDLVAYDTHRKTCIFNHLVLTHPHRDHACLPEGVLGEKVWCVDTNLMPPAHQALAADWLNRSIKERNALFSSGEEQASNELKFDSPDVSFRLVCGGGYAVNGNRFIGRVDSSDPKASPNVGSLGFIINFKDFTIFLAGDMTTDVESDIKNFLELQHEGGVDLCKANHHGTRNSEHNGNDFLSALNPKITYVPSWRSINLPSPDYIKRSISKGDGETAPERYVYVGNLCRVPLTSLTAGEEARILNFAHPKECKVEQSGVKIVHNSGGVAFSVLVWRSALARDSDRISEDALNAMRYRISKFSDKKVPLGGECGTNIISTLLHEKLGHNSSEATSPAKTMNFKCFDFSIAVGEGESARPDNATENSIVNLIGSGAGFAGDALYSPFRFSGEFGSPSLPQYICPEIYNNLTGFGKFLEEKYPEELISIKEDATVYFAAKTGIDIFECYDNVMDETGGIIYCRSKGDHLPEMSKLWFFDHNMKVLNLKYATYALLYASSKFVYEQYYRKLRVLYKKYKSLNVLLARNTEGAKLFSDRYLSERRNVLGNLNRIVDLHVDGLGDLIQKSLELVQTNAVISFSEFFELIQSEPKFRSAILNLVTCSFPPTTILPSAINAHFTENYRNKTQSSINEIKRKNSNPTKRKTVPSEFERISRKIKPAS